MDVGLCPFPWHGSDLARIGLVTCLAFVQLVVGGWFCYRVGGQFLAPFLKRCVRFYQGCL
jgi:hypothetical protein